MSAEPRQALYAHLLADPSVREAVGEQVYQRRVEKKRLDLPVRKPLIIVWPPISNVPVRDLNGVIHRRCRLQVTCMADKQLEAEKAARAVIAAVEGFTGVMAGALNVVQATVDNDRQVDQEGVDEIHHHIDILITYKE